MARQTGQELIACPPPEATPGDAERHAIFAYALMAITHHYWNGNKYGRGVLYPRNSVTDPTTERGAAGGDYLGHNGSLLIFGERNNALMPVERTTTTSLDSTPQAYFGFRLVLRHLTEDDINSKVLKRRAGGTHAEFERLKRSATPARVHIGLRVGLPHDTTVDREGTASAAADVVLDYPTESFAGFVGISAGLNR
jgi:hypothetical protein